MGEILAGGVLAFILLKRIQKEALPQEAEQAAPPAGAEEYDLANRV